MTKFSTTVMQCRGPNGPDFSGPSQPGPQRLQSPPDPVWSKDKNFVLGPTRKKNRNFGPSPDRLILFPISDLSLISRPGRLEKSLLSCWPGPGPNNWEVIFVIKIYSRRLNVYWILYQSLISLEFCLATFRIFKPKYYILYSCLRIILCYVV